MLDVGRRTRTTAEGILWDRRVIKRSSTLCRAPWRQGAVVATKGSRRQRHGGAECCAANGDRENAGISVREVRNEDGTGFEGTPLGRGAGAVGGGSG